MALKLINKKAFSKALLIQSKRIEQALIFQLGALVAELENHAKVSAGYVDRTSNLKSSIGGVVLKNGNPITYKGFEGKGEGVAEGKNFIDSLISNYPTGYTILVVAGMEYASSVENYHGLNVLKKTELKMNSDLPKAMLRLKRSIDKGF